MNQLRVDAASTSTARAERASRVQKALPLRGWKSARLWLAAGALAGTGILGGIAANAAGLLALSDIQQPQSHGPGLDPSKPVFFRLEDTLAAFGSISYDYNPFNSPAVIGAASQVIVQGTVEGVRAGRAGTGIHSIVLVLHAESVVKGGLPLGNDGNVYLELTGGNSSDPLYFAKAFPKGAEAVAFMVPAWDGPPREVTDVEIENPKAGRPDGQALYLPAGPQGLILQVGDHDVVWPLVGEHAPGKIADTLPGGQLIQE